MTQSELACALCGARLADANLCQRCATAVASDLADVPLLSPALVGSFTRQSRLGQGGGSKSAETPLPYYARAYAVASALRNCLTTWTRELDLGDAPAAANSPDLARWLGARIERIRHHVAAAEIATDLHRVVSAAKRTVDRAPDRIYAGPCGAELEHVLCECELYADMGRSWVVCPMCRTSWDVAGRRKWLLAEAEDVLARPSLIARAVTALGEPVTQDRIGMWKARGRIVPHGRDHDGRDLLRVGDVLDLLAADAARPARRKTG